MSQKTIAVTGASGHIGQVVVEKLKAQGHTVRPVSRRDGVNADDAAALTQAFSGVDAVFLMIPPEVTAANIRARQNEIGNKMVQAVRAANVRRVVLLSSIEAHLSQGTGPILGLHDMEERLKAESIPERVFVRPTYFMENHLHAVPLIKQAGFYGAAIRPDLKLPMIATCDIGACVAELLAEEKFSQPLVRELLGPKEYVFSEAVALLGQAIGKPGLAYKQFPYEAARPAMIGSGLSASYTDALLEMTRHFNESPKIGTEPRSAKNTTPTSIEQFARDVFAPAFR